MFKAYRKILTAHYKNHHPHEAKDMRDALKLLTEIIRDSEGCCLLAYQCPAKIWTVGWGETGQHVTKNTVWTQTQADANLQVMALKTLKQALSESPCLAHASPERVASVSDFIYNAGLGNYRKSGFKKAVDQENWTLAANELGKWVYGGGKKLSGLVVRRAKEAKLMAIA